MPLAQPVPAPARAVTPDHVIECVQTSPPPYTAPAILFRARLEATAAFCGEAPFGKSFGVCDALGTINS